MPRVSVIMPTYNRAHCVCDAVDSVLAQTMPDLELLLVDDGSDDGTAELLQARFCDPRLRYLPRPRGGQSAARNFGLGQVRGEWVAQLDSDDLWKPVKLERSLACAARNPRVDFIFTSCCSEHEDRERLEAPDEALQRMTDKRFLLSGFVIKQSTALFRSALLARDPELRYGPQRTCEDYGFLWKVAMLARRIAYSPECLTQVRSFGDNLTLSHKFESMVTDQLEVIGRTLDWMERREVDDGFREPLRELRYWQVRNLLAFDLMGCRPGRFLAHLSRYGRALSPAARLKLALRALRTASSGESRLWLKTYGTHQY